MSEIFTHQERLGLMVYLHYNRDARKVSAYGEILYHSRKLRYVVLYVNQNRVEAVMSALKKEKFVKQVVPSYVKELDQNFVGNLWR